MKRTKYHESFKSRVIVLARQTLFKAQKVKKKLKKIWGQRKEYFSPEYFNSKKSLPPLSKESPVSDLNASAAESKYHFEDLSDKLAVYTCVFGPYDMVKEPLCVSKWCEYYIITDQDVPKSSKWIKLSPDLPNGFSEWPNAIKNRYFKMHPEKVFPNHRYSMYIDGNVHLLADIYPYIKKLNGRFIGIHDYPLNDCFYVNAPFLESLKLVPPEVNEAQVEAYRSEGFPEHFGYFECTLLLREHNHPMCIKLMDTWWEQYCTWVKRDQQCLPYSLWKCGLSKHDVACLGPNLRKTERFTLHEHRHAHKLVEGGPQAQK